MFLRKKTVEGKRSALRIHFDEKGKLERVDYKGIDALKTPGFISITGSEAAKFKFAVYELGIRGLLSVEDIRLIAEKIKIEKEGSEKQN